MAKNFVSNDDKSVRVFDNPILDFLSRVHFTVPLLIYVPMVVYFLYKAIFVYQLSVLYIIPFFALGLITWSFTEYNMHRFVFHWMPPGELGAKINFMFHGVHHSYPRDSMRLVMVPAISLPLCALFYFTFLYLLGERYLAPFFSGLVLGYLFYDMTHYALHHLNFKSKFCLDLKQHHMIHHYSDPDNGFGVSTKFWDLIYRTTFKKKTDKPVIVEEREHLEVTEVNH